MTARASPVSSGTTTPRAAPDNSQANPSGTTDAEELPEGDTIKASELLEPAVGENLDDEVEAALEDDYEEPTESQKRELVKIHRTIGHPPKNDFGRALRNAGVKRNLIRWAVKELRCPVCESRVHPPAKRPGALPRSLRFNETVGVDLVEFIDNGFDKILANMVCWGTGFQMAVVIPDKTSASARDAFDLHWVRHYGLPQLVVTDQGPEFMSSLHTLAKMLVYNISSVAKAHGNKDAQNVQEEV